MNVWVYLLPLLISAQVLVTDTKILFECWEMFCFEDWRGDALCDINCMNPMCNFDSADKSSSTWQARFWSSDCVNDCLGNFGCEVSMLGDGTCHEECNNEVCGFDIGDCAYCAEDCTIDLLENDTKDEVCNTEMCRFDNGQFGWCNSECDRELYDNSVCDEVCNDYYCEYDNNNCQSSECSPGCLDSMLLNDTCDPACDTDECLYDFGYCQCAYDCTNDDLEQPCESDLESGFYEPCDNPDCKFKNNKCGDCSSGCFSDQLGDGVCDDWCNVSDCEYDYGDCGCYPGCNYVYNKESDTWEGDSGCAWECLNIDCAYAKFPGGCEDENVIEQAMLHHIITGDYYSQYTEYEDCYIEGCTYDYIADTLAFGYCMYIECASSYCLDCLGFQYDECEDENCAYCDEDGECIRCKYKQVGRTCLKEDEECPSGTEEYSFASGLTNCVSQADFSSKNNPTYIYVTSAMNSTCPDGSEENTFSSLAEAFSKVSDKYTIVKICSGVHYYEYNDEISGVYITDKYNPLFKDNDNQMKELIIESDSDATIMFCNKNPMKIQANTELMIIRNLDFSGSKFLDNYCSEEYCKYCPYFEEKAGADYDDRKQQIEVDIPKYCEELYNEYSLIVDIPNSTIQITNVTFSEFRFQPNALIQTEGNLNLENVNFYKIQPNKAGYVIRMEGNSPNYPNFHYNTGLVSYLNDGYEISESIDLSGFLDAQYFEVAYIKNVNFEWNLIIRNSDDHTYTLLYFHNFQGNVTIENCVFENIITSRLIDVDVMSLTYTDFKVDAEGVSQAYAQTHFTLKNNTFENIGATGYMISYEMSNSLHNLHIQDNSFENILAYDIAFNIINYGGYDESDLEGGEFTLIDEDNNKQTVEIPSRNIKIINSYFNRISFVSYIWILSDVVNVEISSLEYHNSGDEYPNYMNDAMISLFINNPDSYIILDVDPGLLSALICTASVYLKGIENLSMDTVKFSNITCNSDSTNIAGLHITDTLSGTNSITNLEIYDIPKSYADGCVLRIERTGEFYLKDVVITNVTDTRMAAAAFVQADNISIYNLTVKDYVSQFRSPIVFDGVLQFYMNMSHFENTEVLFGNGGAVSYLCSLLYSVEPFVNISYSTFINSRAAIGKGGSVYLDSMSSTKMIELMLTEVNFADSQAFYGGAVFIEDTFSIKESIVDTLYFQNCSSNNGGVFEDNHFNGLMNAKNLTFEDNTGFYCGFKGHYASSEPTVLIIEDSYFENNQCTFGVNYVTTQTDVITQFRRLSFVGNGGISTSVSDGNGNFEDCSFTDNSVGISFNNNGNGVVSNSTFTNGKTGVVCENSSQFICDQCSFKGLTESAIAINKDSHGEIHDSEFIENISPEEASAISIQSTSTNTTVYNTRFYRNSGAIATILLLNAELLLDNCVMDSNSATGMSAGIYAPLSTLYLKSSEFRNHHNIASGGFISMSTSDAYIEDCVFASASASDLGGAIYAIYGDLSIRDSIFQDISGGAIAASGEVNLLVKNTTFSNIQHELGAAIYQLSGTAEIESSTFENNSKSAIYVDSMLSLVVDSCTFAENTGQQGGSLISHESVEVVIRNSVFTDSSAQDNGGAVYLEILAAFSDKAEYLIENSEFSRSTGQNGGAIYFSNLFLKIKDCDFTSNSAVADGGAFIILCPLNSECYSDISGSTFTSNSAENAGGAIKWSEKFPTVSSSSFSSNSAFYGNDIASYGIRLEEISDSTGYVAAPGQYIDFFMTMELKDHYNNTVVTDSSSTASLVAHDFEISLSGNTKVTAVNGVYNFTEVIIGYTPDSNITIGMVSDAITESTQGSSESPHTYDSEIDIDLQLRDCIIGEEKLSSSCNRCEEGSYSLSPEILCQECKNEAVCPGGWEMYPKSTYWRPDSSTDVFYKCPNPAACLGSQTNTDHIGSCEDGYTGHMCQACVRGYSRSSENTCSKCPEMWANVAILIGIGFGMVLFSIFLVRSTLNSAYTPKALHSIYIKIMMNYIQLVYLTTQFNLSWPDFVMEMFDMQKSTATVSDSIFSIDCYVEDGYEEEDYHKSYYAKLVVMSILPIFLILFSVLIWVLIGRKRGDYSVLNKEMITTIIVLFFFIHPSLVKSLFSIFSCREIEGHGLWLIENLEVECWDEDHTFYSVLVALPALLIWGFGLPAFILMAMYRRRNSLCKIKNRLRFGFLYNGFRQRRFYWEFVILYRKMLIICLAVFFSTVSIPIQALTVLFLLAMSLFLQSRFDPFVLKHLNNLETTAILVATVTIYCGLYYLTNHLDEASKILFFFLMIGLNVGFISYWVCCMGKQILSVMIQTVPFLKKRFDKADGLENSVIEQPQFKPFRFMNREKLFYTLNDQTMEHLRVVDNDPLSSYPSMTNLYMESARWSLNNLDDLDSEPEIICGVSSEYINNTDRFAHNRGDEDLTVNTNPNRFDHKQSQEIEEK